MNVTNILSIPNFLSKIPTKIVAEAETASPLFLISIALAAGAIIAVPCVLKSLSGRVQLASKQSNSPVARAQPAISQNPDNAKFAASLEALQSPDAQTRKTGRDDFFAVLSNYRHYSYLGDALQDGNRAIAYALGCVATKQSQKVEGKQDGLHGWKCDPKAPLWQESTEMEACEITLGLMRHNRLDPKQQPEEVVAAYRVYYGEGADLNEEIAAFRTFLEGRQELALVFAHKIVSDFSTKRTPHETLVFFEVLKTLVTAQAEPNKEIVNTAVARAKANATLRGKYLAFFEQAARAYE